MPQPIHLDPSSYSADGGPAGALIVHGLTGSVAETRPMGEYLAAKGMTVRCPLLSGHGTSPEELTHINRTQWIADVEAALHDLQRRCEAVFACGFSLGSLLALWLGAEHPDGVAGLIVMAPPVQMRNRLAPLSVGLRYVLKFHPLGAIGDDDLVDPNAIGRIWCYDDLALWGGAEFYLLQREVRRALPSVRQPILIFLGRRDAQVPPEAAQMVLNRTASTDKDLVWLENSGHNLLADGEREYVWAQSHAWMMDRTPYQAE